MKYFHIYHLSPWLDPPWLGMGRRAGLENFDFYIFYFKDQEMMMKWRETLVYFLSYKDYLKKALTIFWKKIGGGGGPS